MVIAIYCNLCLVSGSMLLHEVATHRYILLHRCLTGHPLFGVPGIPFYLSFNVEHAGPGYVYVPDRTLEHRHSIILYQGLTGYPGWTGYPKYTGYTEYTGYP